MATTTINELIKQTTLSRLEREFSATYSSTPQTLRVLQWNILAQGLANPRNFVRVKKETLAYDTRKWRILEQIRLRQPDLCALEEVDIYECFLREHLSTFGYTCFYTPNPKSPCFSFQFDTLDFKGPDGILLCYKTELFDEIHRYSYQPEEGEISVKPFFTVIELKHRPTSVNILFLGTHLKAQKPFSHIRNTQTQIIVQYLAEQYPTQTHMIIAGDFNGESDEPFYDLIKKAGLSSAYRTVSGDEEPAFTTWKFRVNAGVENEQCRAIDYIFYKPEGFTPTAVLKLPTKEDIGVNGLPSNEYASDHLVVEAVFTIKP